ncbi:MAG: LD-carboxypeptidase [Flavobacteriales bacterium]
MLTPPPLKYGSKAALISTARKVDSSQVKLAVEQFRSWGIELVAAPNLFSEFHQFSGTDEERAADLQWAINQSEIEAIICFRGGYGTVRIIDKIDFSPLLTRPKWIAGYSDVTVLHARLNTLGVVSIHGSMPVNFPRNTQEAINTLRQALFGELIEIESSGNSLNRHGIAEGELVGGNLSIIYSLQGSKDAFKTSGKVLFIEDLDEYLYHIDRMMQNLKRSGVLSSIKGLIVGGMTDMRDNAVPFGKIAEEIILDAVSEYSYPVCFGFPAGHINDNRAVIFGKKIRLEVSSTSSLTYV